jgi:hypothetical protein
MNDNDRYWRDASDDMADSVGNDDRFADEATLAYLLEQDGIEYGPGGE